MSIDERLIKALHVETLRRRDLPDEDEHRAVFQTSTIKALLDGAYDGDLSFRELREHGDFGLGTLDAVDGEMVAVDGRFYRAGPDGALSEVPETARTPFAVVTFFEPDTKARLEESLDHSALLERVEGSLPEAGCQAVRVDGDFDMVKARSVHRQAKPYPPLAEVAAHQSVFTLRRVSGTLVGFRFPDYAQGIEVPGYHLHFVTTDRTRGGHVLDCRLIRGELAVARFSDLHVELPAGVYLPGPEQIAAERDLLGRIEGETGAGKRRYGSAN